MSTARAASTTTVAPSAEQAVKLLVYLFDRLHGGTVQSALGAQLAPSVRTVSRHGVEHAFFAAKRSLLFYDSGLVAVTAGRRECARLLLLEDASWLLWRYRMGIWNTEPIAPPTMCYHTAELQPIFEELNIQGGIAIQGIRKVLHLIRPETHWSQSWQGLSWQVEQRYQILV